MKLSGSEIKELRNALTDAFRSQTSLKMLIRESLDIHIEEITSAENLTEIVFEIIQWAEAHNKLDILIKAAYEENPNGAKLKAFVKKQLTEKEPGISTHSDEAKTFTFEVVTVNRTGAIINRETRSAQYFTENLGSNVTHDVE